MMYYIHMNYLYTLCFGMLGLSIRKRSSPVFSKTLTTTLKGFFAICVLLHHLGQTSNLTGYFGICNDNLGGIAVGVFFMLSAFGIGLSYKKSPDKYPKRLLLIKLPLLYLVQVIINLIYYLIFVPSLNFTQTLLSIFNLDIFFGLDRLNGYSWFITTILFVYGLIAITMLISQKVKYKKLFIVIVPSIILLGASLFLILCPIIDPLYVRSLMCFALGLWYSLYFDQINNWLAHKKVFLISMITISTLTLIASLLPLLNFTITEYFLSVMVCLLIILLAQKLELSSKTYTFLGEISLEIYLFQHLAIDYVISASPVLWGGAIAGVTIIMAYLFHNLYNSITKSFSYLYKKSTNKPPSK